AKRRISMTMNESQRVPMTNTPALPQSQRTSDGKLGSLSCLPLPSFNNRTHHAAERVEQISRAVPQISSRLSREPKQEKRMHSARTRHCVRERPLSGPRALLPALH